jgi:hypothetical protein
MLQEQHGNIKCISFFIFKNLFLHAFSRCSEIHMRISFLRLYLINRGIATKMQIQLTSVEIKSKQQDDPGKGQLNFKNAWWHILNLLKFSLLFFLIDQKR